MPERLSSEEFESWREYLVRSIEELKENDQTLFRRLEEHKISLETRIDSKFNSMFAAAMDLKVEMAVQKSKLSSFAAAVGFFVSLVVSLITNVIYWLFHHQ